MAKSLTSPASDYDALEGNIKVVGARSIDFNANGVIKTTRHLSFNDRDLQPTKPTIRRSLSLGKVRLEGSVTYKTKKLGPSSMESAMTAPIDDENIVITSVSFGGRDISNPFTESTKTIETITAMQTRKLTVSILKAIVWFQNLHRRYKRRRGADEGILTIQKLFKLLDDSKLELDSVLFFEIGKAEPLFSRWSRAGDRVAKVGKGFSKNDKGRILFDCHWLEAVDPRHRYGRNLNVYFKHWKQCTSNQPFFYWLDFGDGQEENINQCPRLELQQQRIKYLVPKEREAYEVVVEDGKFFCKLSRKLLNTSEGSEDTKWIFVFSPSKTLYVGQKKKGTFQHSSFLAGGVASAAGGIDIENGILKAVTMNSGHYRPELKEMLVFVIFLKEKNVDTTEIKLCLKDGGKDIRYEEFTDKSQLDLRQEIIDWLAENSGVPYDHELLQSRAMENKMSSIAVPEDTGVFMVTEIKGLPMGLCNSNVSPEFQSVGDETLEHQHSLSNNPN